MDTKTREMWAKIGFNVETIRQPNPFPVQRVGEDVVVWGLPALESGNEPTEISGIWHICGYRPDDAGHGHYELGLDYVVLVKADDLVPQVFPREYGEWLAAERDETNRLARLGVYDFDPKVGW